MTDVSHDAVSRFWNKVNASILGPYMMDEFSFPVGAGRYRFEAECQIANRLIDHTSGNQRVLDIGSERGFCTEHLAQGFSQVVFVEPSQAL